MTATTTSSSQADHSFHKRANPAVPWGRHQHHQGLQGPPFPAPLLLRQDSRPPPTFLSITFLSPAGHKPTLLSP